MIWESAARPAVNDDKVSSSPPPAGFGDAARAGFFVTGTDRFGALRVTGAGVGVGAGPDTIRVRGGGATRTGAFGRLVGLAEAGFVGAPSGYTLTPAGGAPVGSDHHEASGSAMGSGSSGMSERSSGLMPQASAE